MNQWFFQNKVRTYKNRNRQIWPESFDSSYFVVAHDLAVELKETKTQNLSLQSTVSQLKKVVSGKRLFSSSKTPLKV